VFILGLTGGIACGKSTASAWLAAQGARVLDADRIARQVVAKGSEGLQAVLAQFGEQFVTDSGELDRAALGALVFADRAALRRLEQILHPRIAATLDRELEVAARDGVDLVVIDAALLFEMGLDRRCQQTWAIVCHPETQIGRLAARNGLDRAAAVQRLAAQATAEQQRSRCTWAIDNDGSMAALQEALAVRLAGLPLIRTARTAGACSP
jgi:dephospho-CoA kinase